VANLKSRDAKGRDELSTPRLFLPIAVSVSIFLLAAGASARILGTSEPDTLARVGGGSPLRIGYSVEAPYAFVAPGGKVSGESPTVARAIAERLGMGRIEWRRLEFSSLIGALESDRIDVIAAGMFVTPERRARILFSEPTFETRRGLLVLKGNPLGLRSYAQAASSKAARIAVLSGSVEEAALLELGASPDRLVVSPDAGTALAALSSGLADGLALSSPTVRWMAARSRGVLATVEDLEQSPGQGSSFGAFGFRKTDGRLRDEWDGALRDFVGSAEHVALVSPFGFRRADLPDRHRRAGGAAR